MNGKNKKLVIIGSGEFAAIAFEYFTHDSEYEVCAFSVDREYLKGDEYLGLPLVDRKELLELYPSKEYEAFVAIPASELNSLRERIYLETKSFGYTMATYISSRAFFWRNAKIGDNCFIFENNTVQPFVTIGNNVILWSGNHIGHQTEICDNVFVSSHVVISGYCKVGRNCFLGVNSTLNDHTEVPEFSILGSGSLVTKKLKEKERIYVGNPAKPFPRKSALDVKL
ncbi:acetyltransferase [Vibrio vulnificus]|nr:acetyltransferase [Vibrio vulnificus]ELC9717430.1 acetyltransferase [Vibrio vulnificus]ELS0762136.1 acetyltransferase [Vibrio vulnificus]ELV8609602.1 acetyltransferase [Vibrio vulnificus]ELV8618427.1 acetyltransferase [Vibrio vulnificus]